MGGNQFSREKKLSPSDARTLVKSWQDNYVLEVFLSAHGRDLKIRDCRGKLLLWYALEFPDVAKRMIVIDPTIVSEYGPKIHLLHTAIRMSDIGLTRMMLENGCSDCINELAEKRVYLSTSLAVALHQPVISLGIARLLLKYGAKPYVKGIIVTDLVVQSVKMCKSAEERTVWQAANMETISALNRIILRSPFQTPPHAVPEVTFATRGKNSGTVIPVSEAALAAGGSNGVATVPASAQTVPKSVIYITPTCCICEDAPTTVCLNPCGHSCICAMCYAEIEERGNQCPMCRAAVTSTTEIRLS